LSGNRTRQTWLLLLEAQEGELYHPSDEEWLASQEGLDQARRGEFVSDEEMQALWKRHSL
jgi:predicted transcriptional regulator